MVQLDKKALVFHVGYKDFVVGGHSQPAALFVCAACPVYIGSVGCVGHRGVWGTAECEVEKSVGYIRVEGTTECGVEQSVGFRRVWRTAESRCIVECGDTAK